MTVKVGSQTIQQTSVKKETVNPVWDETFSFHVKSMDDDVVLQVYLHVCLSTHAHTGVCTWAHVYIHVNAQVFHEDQIQDKPMGGVQLGTVKQLLSEHPTMTEGLVAIGGLKLQPIEHQPGLHLTAERGDHYTIRTVTGRPGGCLGSSRRKAERPTVLLVLSTEAEGALEIPLIVSDNVVTFKPGQTDTFDFDLPYFAHLERIKVRLDSHDSSTAGSWYLEKVFIKKCESTSNPHGTMWLVDVAAWLGTPNLDQQPCWSRTSMWRQPKAAQGASDQHFLCT